MSDLAVLSQFKQCLVTFLDELIDQFPTEPDLVFIRIFIKDQIPIEAVMNHFIGNILPHRDQIKNRVEQFFLDNDVLFEDMSDRNKGKVNHFRRIWRSPVLDDDNKDVIWKWFDSFVYLADKYIKLRSRVEERDEEGSSQGLRAPRNEDSAPLGPPEEEKVEKVKNERGERLKEKRD